MRPSHTIYLVAGTSQRLCPAAGSDLGSDRVPQVGTPKAVSYQNPSHAQSSRSVRTTREKRGCDGFIASEEEHVERVVLFVVEAFGVLVVQLVGFPLVYYTARRGGLGKL